MKNRGMIQNSKTCIQAAPNACGVYLFKEKSKPLYIGKSVNLRARLLSHLENAKLDMKENAVVSKSNEIEYIVTDSDFKAILLEAELIRTHHPKYNRRWQDDKSYLYVKITLSEEFPKILLSRKPSLKFLSGSKKDKYFGPFPSTRTLTQLLREIRKVFHFCTQKRISKKPCFYSKIGLCNPCPNEITHLQTAKERKVLKRSYRRNVFRIIQVLNGNTELVLKNLYTELKKLGSDENYEGALKLRDRILAFEHLIHQRLFITDIGISYNQSEKRLASLFEFLVRYFPVLKSLHRIECYDVSNFSLKDATASMVTCIEGFMDKSQYRKFKIRNLKADSDFTMLEEVLKRRLKQKWELANLIVIDGGRPQVRSALGIIKKQNRVIPVMGIAKHPDRLVIGDAYFSTLRFPTTHMGFNLIRQIRDESHRFARKYHLFLRDKKLMV